MADRVILATHEPIPAIIEELVVHLGGDVPCCEDLGTGSVEPGDEVAGRLADRGAAVLANHGLVTCGPTPETALHNAALAEGTAKIVWGAMGATLHPLPDTIVADTAGVYRRPQENR